MQLRTVRDLRWGRSLLLAAIVACATLGATASTALARDGDTDSYTANVSPASVPGGSSTTFDVALTNTSTPGSGLASAAITPPLGFRVTGASLPAGAQGHAFVLFNVVILDHLSVPSGSTLDVSVTATAPAGCTNRFTRWLTVANEGGFFGEFLSLDASSSVTTTTTCATGLKFAGGPNDALVNSVITGSANDTSGPPVTVDLVDSGGNVVNTSGTPVTIALGNDRGASLGGTLTQNTVNGVATFNDLKVDLPNNGYTLTASSGSLTNATSNPFNENNQAKACTTGTDCTDTITSGSGSLVVDIPNPGTDATLTESVDVGTPMDGPGSDPKADPGCANYTPPAASADWYEFVEHPADNRTFDAKTVTWTVNGTTSDGFQVCFGAPYDFPTGFDANGAPIEAPPGTLPDGTQGFVGLLPQPCGQGEIGIPPPCATVTTTTDAAGVPSAVAVVQIPAGEQGDPMMGR